MDATDGDISGTRPEDKEKQAVDKKLYVPAHVTAIICAASVLLLWLLSSTIGTITLFVGAAISGWRYWRAHSQVKGMINESKKLRQQILQSFKNAANPPLAALAQ